MRASRLVQYRDLACGEQTRYTYCSIVFVAVSRNVLRTISLRSACTSFCLPSRHVHARCSYCTRTVGTITYVPPIADDDNDGDDDLAATLVTPVISPDESLPSSTMPSSPKNKRAPKRMVTAESLRLTPLPTLSSHYCHSLETLRCFLLVGRHYDHFLPVDLDLVTTNATLLL